MNEAPWVYPNDNRGLFLGPHNYDNFHINLRGRVVNRAPIVQDLDMLIMPQVNNNNANDQIANEDPIPDEAGVGNLADIA